MYTDLHSSDLGYIKFTVALQRLSKTPPQPSDRTFHGSDSRYDVVSALRQVELVTFSAGQRPFQAGGSPEAANSDAGNGCSSHVGDLGLQKKRAGVSLF